MPGLTGGAVEERKGTKDKMDTFVALKARKSEEGTRRGMRGLEGQRRAVNTVGKDGTSKDLVAEGREVGSEEALLGRGNKEEEVGTAEEERTEETTVEGEKDGTRGGVTRAMVVRLEDEPSTGRGKSGKESRESMKVVSVDDGVGTVKAADKGKERRREEKRLRRREGRETVDRSGEEVDTRRVERGKVSRGDRGGNGRAEEERNILANDGLDTTCEGREAGRNVEDLHEKGSPD